MEQERLGQLVRQHAETSRLMGVDFVPAYRTGEDDGEDEVQAGSLAEHAQEQATEAAPAVAVPVTLVEAKPSTVIGAGREAKQAALDALRARYEKDCPHK